MLTQGRFQKYKIDTGIFGVIDCRHDAQSPPELERIPHPTHLVLFFLISCSVRFPIPYLDLRLIIRIRTDLYRML